MYCGINLCQFCSIMRQMEKAVEMEAMITTVGTVALKVGFPFSLFILLVSISLVMNSIFWHS